MSDVIPRPSPCNGVLPHAPPLSLGACREGSRCSNSSLSHPVSDPLPLKRVRTGSQPLTGSSPRNVDGHTDMKASEACMSPASDACAPSGVSQPDGKGSTRDQRRSTFACPVGDLADAVGHGEAASLPRLLSIFGEAASEDSTSEVGIFGQAILVSSRLGAYCGAAWRLLEGEGAVHADPDKASPLSNFCDVLKLLMRQRIIHRVQELYSSALTSEDAARSLLHHVLLWQYLKHRNVMDLVTLSLRQESRRRACPDECFLATLGVPIVQWAIQQAKGSMKMAQKGSTHGSAHSRGDEVDMAAVLRMVYESAHMRSPSCTHAAVQALAEDPESLHRVARFLSQHHGLVTQILSGVDHTPNQLLVLYMALAHASALLQPDSAMEVQDTAAISAARTELLSFNASVEARQRAAKATILDVRISAARSASWNRDVASCTVKAAVSQRFREVYLFKELKELLHTWTGMLDASVESSTLPNDAVLDASAAAAATFDPSPLGLRFRVPSAGFLLVWCTSPNSPAHNLSHRAATCMKSCPRFGSDNRAHSLQRSSADLPEVRIEVSGPPVETNGCKPDACGDAPTSPQAVCAADVAAQEVPAAMLCQTGQRGGENAVKSSPALPPRGSHKHLPASLDTTNPAALTTDAGAAAVKLKSIPSSTGLAAAGAGAQNQNTSMQLAESPTGARGAQLGNSLKRALE